MRISWLMWMPAGPTESKQTILYAGRGFCRGDGEGMHPEKTLLREKPGMKELQIILRRLLKMPISDG